MSITGDTFILNVLLNVIHVAGPLETAVRSARPRGADVKVVVDLIGQFLKEFQPCSMYISPVASFISACIDRSSLDSVRS